MAFHTPAQLVLLALLFPTGATGDCGDCSYSPKRTELCSDHEGEERKALAAGEKKLDDGDPAVRKTALGEVAALTQFHASAPSRDVAKFLAKGLADRAIEVRSAALPLLLAGQHPDESVKALLDAWGAAEKTYLKYLGDLKLTAKNKDKFTKKSTAIFSRVMDFPLELRHAADLVAALGALPDKRCESELIDLIEVPVHKANAVLAVSAAGGLLALGTYDGFKAVVEFQDDLASALGGKKLEARYPISDPLAFLDWVMVHDRELRESDFDLVAQELAEAAKQRGLKGMPGSRARDTGAWKKWLKKKEGADWQLLEDPVPVEQRAMPRALGRTNEPGRPN